MQESIVFLLRVQYRRKESSRSLSHLMMSFLFVQLTSSLPTPVWEKSMKEKLVFGGSSSVHKSFFSKSLTTVIYMKFHQYSSVSLLWC